MMNANATLGKKNPHILSSATYTCSTPGSASGAKPPLCPSAAVTLCSQEVAAEKREKAKGEKVEVRKKKKAEKKE